jgi:hypothetical protein
MDQIPVQISHQRRYTGGKCAYEKDVKHFLSLKNANENTMRQHYTTD